MKFRTKLGVWAIVMLLVITIGFSTIPPAKARIVLDPNKSFSPSVETYTNKTMSFTIGDPYDGYSYWTYDVGSTTNAPSDNMYAMDTDQNAEYAYFGFAEFVDHSVVSAETRFKTTSLVGTYHFQPLGYFYQYTNLESNTRWALVLDWDASGLDLYYNTGNGDTPSSVSLNNTAVVEIGAWYTIRLSNLGDQTYVYVEREYDSVIVFEGYKTTSGYYDATSLYGGFGQWCSGAGNIYGWHDYLTIIDTEFTYSADGTGFGRIDAYINEEFAQTLYDADGADPILDIYVTVTNITLLVDCWLNSTAYGISTLAEGKNIIRQCVTVTSTNDTIVFSQTNLTYISAFDYGDNVFLYQYSVELDFTIIYGNIYTVVIIYEIFG